MSIQFMDNFQQYGTTESNLLDGVYADYSGVALADDPDGFSTGKVLTCGGSAFGNPIRKVLTTIEQTTVGVGFRLWLSNLPSSNGQDIFYFRDAANDTQLTVEVNSTGTMTVKRGSTVLATTAAPVITAAGWYHIEMKAFFDQTAGTFELRVNGVPKIDLDTIDTVDTSLIECSQVVLTYYDSGDAYFKDFIIWDGNGTANNDFIGDVQIVSLIPVSDNSLNWTTSTGATGYNLIDESIPDDADYVYADDTLPAASVFNLSDLDEDVVSVKGLMSFVRMMKTDGGTAQVQVGLVSGSSTDLGADRAITVAETYWMDSSELDPDTAAAWTPIAVNALKLQIDRTV
jgi:hypothetical protein